jgi:hypothetical protein
MNSFATVEDLSIDPKNGDTVVIQKTGNPTGEMTFLNDNDLSFKQVLNLLPFPSEKAMFEVELNKKNSVTYLIQVDKTWVLGTIKKENNTWTVNSPSLGLNGVGNAKKFNHSTRWKLSIKPIRR